MTDRQMWDAALAGFIAHWQQRVDEGNSPPLNRTEEIAIRLFLEWLVVNYELKARNTP